MSFMSGIRARVAEQKAKLLAQQELERAPAFQQKLDQIAAQTSTPAALPSTSAAPNVTAPAIAPAPSVPSFEEQLAQLFEQQMKYRPELAAQQFALTAQYEPQYAALLRDLIAQERAADLTQVEAAMPQIAGIQEQMLRPELRNLRDILTGQVTGELQAGSQLTPEMTRDVTQGLRSAQMARGLGMGQAAANQESVRRALEGQKLLESRQAKALGLIQEGKQGVIDPFAAVLGRSSQTTGTAASQTATGQSEPSTAQLAGQQLTGLGMEQSNWLNQATLENQNFWNAANLNSGNWATQQGLTSNNWWNAMQSALQQQQLQNQMEQYYRTLELQRYSNPAAANVPGYIFG